MTHSNTCQVHCRIVLVEDSEDDAELLLTFLKRENISVEVLHLADGKTAFEWMQSALNSAAKDTYNFVLLDLNLPKMTGQEILQRLELHDYEDRIRIAVFSGSENPDDKKQCLSLGAKAYFVKPWDLQGYKSFVRGPFKTELHRTCPFLGEESGRENAAS